MIVGSTYFFNNIKGFSSKDIDILEIVSSPKDFKYSYQLSRKGKCVFKWKKMSPKKFIKITLERNCPMEIGKFLIPEFCKEIGFTIEHLLELKSLVEKLDDKHKYESIIFDSYIENNDFILTQEQLLKSYNEYKKYR